MTRSDTLYIKIGIATRDEMRDRTLAIAGGLRKPASDEPKIWFTSLDAVAKVFSQKNMLMLELIRNSKPVSIEDLATRMDGLVSEVTEQIHDLERVGLIEMKQDRHGFRRPISKRYSKVKIEAETGVAA